MTPVGPFRRRDAVAQAVRDDIWKWQHEYLAQYERDFGLRPRQLSPFKTAAVRHGQYLHPSELALGPVCVLWIAGARNHTSDAQDGDVIADLEIGVRLAVAATRDATSDFLHHYAAVVSQLLLDFPTAGGKANRLDPVDEDYSPFEVEDERVRMGVDLTFLAVGVNVGRRRSGPPPGSEPRPNPYPTPWPDAPTALTTDVTVEPADPEDLP